MKGTLITSIMYFFTSYLVKKYMIDKKYLYFFTSYLAMKYLLQL